MRQLLAVALAGALLGAAPPVASAPLPPEQPTPVVRTPGGEGRLLDRFRFPAPPRLDEGCVLPVSTSLRPCPELRRRAPLTSCVLPVVEGTLVVPRCPPPRRGPDEGRIVPLQSATVE